MLEGIYSGWQELRLSKTSMKRSRYLLIGVATVAILMIAGWLLRNSIVRQVSNPLLAEYDIELVDISLDALATSAASIGYLELVHAKGTTIVIEDLTLPLTSADDAIKTYSARRVSVVTTTRNDEAPFELALLINQFLSLSDNLAGNTINVAEFDLPPYPGVRNLMWAISDSGQHLRWTIESIDMSLATNRTSEAAYDVRFSLPGQPGSGIAASAVDGELLQSEQGVSILGHSMFELPGWQAIAKLADVLPPAVDLKSGTGELQFEADIPFDVARSPTIDATVSPTSPWQIGYAGESGDLTDVLVTGGKSIDIRASVPELDWSLQQAGLSLLVTNEAWSNLPLSITDLSCQAGPVCSMNADVVWLDADTPIGKAAKIAVSSVLEVAFPDAGVRVDVQPNAHLELSGFSTPDNSMKRFDARLVSAAAIQFADDGWLFSADSVDAEIESLSLSTDISMTAALYLENIEARETDHVVSASTGIYSPSPRLAFDSKNIAVPGIKGRVTLQDTRIEFDLATVDLLRDGLVSGHHILDSGTGSVVIDGIELSFENEPLSTRVVPWENDFDISSGNVAINVHASWAQTVSGSKLEARSSLKIDALAGLYADIAFIGASTNVEINYDTEGMTVAPTSIDVSLVDIGLPIEDITADIEIDIDELAIDVDNLRMTAFNGVISAAPFSFSTARDVNNVILTAREVELAELLSIKEFAAVNVTGTIAAVLPITFAEDGVSIAAGKLTGEEPGGVIRYLGGDGLDNGGMSGLGLATSALSNFAYESLTADVNYSKAGDLTLQMQIKGRNPELDEGRPVILNLGVENNVPQMLKSLQAARAVEEILEKRLAD